jgi:hypothetical protein
MEQNRKNTVSTGDNAASQPDPVVLETLRPALSVVHY